MNELHNISRLYKLIDNNLFTICGKLNYNRITDAIIKLSNLVHEYPGDSDDIWHLSNNCLEGVADIIIGAYWHYADWHSGQWSHEYAALYALSQVFEPGMSSIEFDNETYKALETICVKREYLLGNI